MSDIDETSAMMRGDPIWQLEAYRLATCALVLAWADAVTTARDYRFRSVADQLLRAVGPVGANIAEGYSRGGGRDRARFLEYALGSAREARHWHVAVAGILGTDATAERVQRLNGIARLLLVMIRTERRSGRLGD